MELEQRTNRNLEFTQVDISPINDSSPICFQLSRMGNDDISSEEHFQNSKARRGISYKDSQQHWRQSSIPLRADTLAIVEKLATAETKEKRTSATHEKEKDDLLSLIHREHRVATAAFWRTFSDEGKISPGW